MTLSTIPTLTEMSQVHQGQLVQNWINSNYDSTNKFATELASDAPETEFIKTHARYVNLLRNISKGPFVKNMYHKRWQKEIAPKVGITLQEVLKAMGEKDVSRSQGLAPGEYQKELYKLEGKYEGLKEAYDELVTQVKDALEKK